MPAWVPETDKLAEDIERERIRLAFLQEKAWGTPPVAEPVTPMPWNPAPQATPPQPTQPLYPQAPQPPRQSIYRPPAVEPISQTQQFAPRIAQQVPPQTLQLYTPNIVKNVAQDIAAQEEVKSKWWEKPKAWGEIAQEKIGEGISKVTPLSKAVEFIAPVFNWIHENLEKPFAAIILSPFSPDIAWNKGESYKEHAKREYDAWEAPTYVKGAAEFAMPLWWMPWFAWAKVGAKSLSVGSKAMAKIAKTEKMLRVGDKGFLPADELLTATIFNAGRLTKAMENLPIVNRIVKMVGGEGVFITKKEATGIAGRVVAGEKLIGADALTYARMALVKKGVLESMRDGVNRLLTPRIQVLEHSVRGGLKTLLGMDSRGVVTKIVDKTGTSQYLYDVLEGAMKKPGNYDFIGEGTRKYVETLGEIVDDVLKMAKQEGIKVPKRRGLHRIVKGKINPDTGRFEATEFGSLFDKARVHKLQKYGVEGFENVGGGVEYGLDIAESITSTIHHYMRQIARKRFATEVKKLSSGTSKHMWENSPEGRLLKTLKEAPEQLAEYTEATKGFEMLISDVPGIGEASVDDMIRQLTIDQKRFMKHYAGHEAFSTKQYPYEMAKFHMNPSFGSRFFPKDIIKPIEKILGDDGQKWLTDMANISGTSRMTVAAMDLSNPFIQGLAVAGRNPIAWAGMFKRNLEFFIKPENYYKYLTDPKVMATAAERISAGGSGSTFEFFNALLPLQRGLGKLPVAGKPLKGLIGQTYGRAEAAFSGGGEAARNYMWQALRKNALTPEGVLDPARAMDLARTIDRMTGVMSTEALAIGRTQQDFENAFVFFAPRYTRAGLSFVSDALKGSMAGAEARKSLAALAAGGSTMYYGVCKAMGQEPNFNPNSGRFMTIKVGDSHIGIGGIMVALMRFGYDVAVTAVEDPKNLFIPLNEGGLNRWDNPFIRFLYARTAPLTATLYGSLIEQADYFGEPFENVGDWMNFMADKVTPIAVQGVIADPSVVVGVAEFGGLRAFPLSPWELLDDVRDKLSIEQHGQPYDSLNDLEKTRIDKSDSIRKLQIDVDAQTVTRGDATSVGFLNRQRERDTARLVYEESVNKLQAAYDAGQMDGIGFRDELSKASYGLGAIYKHIDTQPEYKDVLKVLKEPRKLGDKSINDIASDAFMTKMYEVDSSGNSIFEDQYGIFQYDKYNAYIEEFKRTWGSEAYQYVLAEKAERDANMPPIYHEYQKAKEILKPMWGIADEIASLFDTPTYKFSETSKGKSLITRKRQQMRAGNKEMERYYTMFYRSNQ